MHTQQVDYKGAAAAAADPGAAHAYTTSRPYGLSVACAATHCACMHALLYSPASHGWSKAPAQLAKQASRCCLPLCQHSTGSRPRFVDHFTPPASPFARADCCCWVLVQVYPLYTLLVTALVHPLLVHWIWVDSSWLNTLSSCRVLDFAGGLAVHALGGLFGLVGAVAVGPRLGRFEGGAVKDLPGHDMAFVTLGTFMLWFGWFGFNSGSVYVYQPNAPASAVQLVAMNTTLAASSAGLASLAVACWWSGGWPRGADACLALLVCCSCLQVACCGVWGLIEKVFRQKVACRRVLGLHVSSMLCSWDGGILVVGWGVPARRLTTAQQHG
eukprot:GHRQ01025698.1.p1 GENE.GHRQ01025698.1~~GHRQ01025698.1.p1  ORF type:complete len:328 (+),score=77.02 GHRQ01025698.1:223-1206(+)